MQKCLKNLKNQIWINKVKINARRNNTMTINQAAVI